jgi:hypothetical protein
VVADLEVDEFMNDDLGSLVVRLGQQPSIERQPARRRRGGRSGCRLLAYVFREIATPATTKWATFVDGRYSV